MAVHFHPDVKILGQAMLDFVRRFRWQNIVVLYKGAEGIYIYAVVKETVQLFYCYK